MLARAVLLSPHPLCAGYEAMADPLPSAVRRPSCSLYSLCTGLSSHGPLLTTAYNNAC
jgi:hypothetical protein